MPVIEIVSELDCSQPTPVWIELPVSARGPSGGALQLVTDGGKPVPAQLEGEKLVALVSGLRANERRRYRLEGASGRGSSGRVTLKEGAPGELTIRLPEGDFSTYHFGANLPRPFFYPVLGPGGTPVTRNFPMKDVPEEKAAKDQDHPHHRSFWTAYDEVNGTDNWSEGPRHGFTKHQKFEKRIEGSVFGGFTASSVWTSREGKPVLDERRTIRVYNVGADRRLLDYDVELKASYEDVHYGDTKEGGILAFRVFHTMKGAEKGHMRNSNGAVGEKEVWGKRAAWLDYVGPVGNEVFGIAMMDHPGNHNHPCRWHARNYGLVGTNPFAQKAFNDGPEAGYDQKKGQTLRFRYRVLIHRGDTQQARVEDAYHDWVQAPKGQVVE